MQLNLTEGAVHLWMVDLSATTNESLLRSYFEYLSPDEHARHGRFLLMHDRVRYLVTRTLVRIALSRYASVAPNSWTFSADAFGKPYIANSDLTASGLRFNVSHSEGLVALALTSGSAVGIDVENRSKRRAPIEIAERYFAANEVSDLNALPLEKRQDRFFDYWTLKEAYLKARGVGLAIPLDAFAFSFPAADKILFDPDTLGDPAGPWHFWQFNPSPDYVAAVCTRRGLVNPTAMVKWIVPLESESSFEEITWQSGCKAS